ncbi:complement C3-like protein, partial [Lates japonicus]
MDGVQKKEVRSVVLNPSAAGGMQTFRIGAANLESIVPNSVPETVINVRGSVLADSIDNCINVDSLASLIQMPGGCVEQNLARITLPLIATHYLDRTNSWEKVGVQRKVEAIQYIRRGYENQLTFRKSDGSYPPYGNQGSSTWAVSEVATTEITLTAFVLIALGEAKHAGIHCTHPDVNMELVIDKTVNYLKSALATSGRRPYTVAITSYALALLGKAQPNEVTQSLLGVAAQDGSHWPDSHNTLFTLEATGYALLALVTMGRMEEAEAPFKWLNSQRRQGGGYGSTQSTMVVLQALSGYLINKPLPDDFSLDVDISLAGRKEISYHFTPSTAYAARSSRLPANPDVEVEARGNGQGIVEVVTYYNQVHEVDEKKPCEHFKLNVTIEESSEQPPADEGKSYQINIQVKALGSRDVRMVVLDISLPTGFAPDISDLEMLLNSVDRYIDNYQIIDNLSDRGSLIIHLFKPSSVTVYEYYNPDDRCSRTYTPSQDKEELSRICRDNVCRCTQGDCCVSKTDSEHFPNREREKFACKSLHHVFKVKVLSVSQSYYDKYEMEITQVIKLGEEAGVEVGQKRFFMSHGGCREGLNLEQGSQYLIIGPKEDQWNIDSETNRFIYMLGKDTWVERWPSSAECSSNPSLQAKCRSLDEAASHLSLSGCTGSPCLAPDLLRTDSQENIYLQADGLSSSITVSISIRDYRKTIMLLQDSVILNPENGFHALKTIQLPSDHLNRKETRNKFVFLKVDFGGLHSEERVLMVSFHSGHIFIQTDKPIYKPGDTVRFRAFMSSPSFKALDSSVTIDIQNPDGVVVKQISRRRAADGVFADTLDLSEMVNEGTWMMTAKFDHWKQNTFTSQFEVKKYGSDLVEAILTGIKVVKSPYVVSFKDIPKYFKPGLPFEFTVQVSHHDGSPANNVLVKLNLLETPLVVNSGTARATINMPDDQRPQTITAEIMQDGLRPEQQVKTHTFVEPYETFNPDRRNYLHISAGTNAVSVGDGLSVKLTIKTADQTQRDLIKHVTYLVISKGKIISAERLDVTGQLLTGIPLTVTPDMMPSFRFVAYYSIPRSSPEEVVSDSIWVDVADSCVGGLKVGPVDGIHRDYTPGRSFRFQVRGDLGAKVSLVAVDSAVYLLNKDRLTQKK